MNPRAATVKRLSTPLLLLAPLALIVVVPAVVYGYQSRVVAAEANDALMAALVHGGVDGAKGVSIPDESLCASADQADMTTNFAELGLDEESHKYSVAGVGFSTAIVDLKGWVDQPGPSGASAPGAADLDERDDIAVELRLIDDKWCVSDVGIQTANES